VTFIETACGPDILIHRKPNDDETFHKNWNQFKQGFGSEAEDDEHWIGNDDLHKYTAFRGYTRLRVEIKKDGNPVYTFLTFYLFILYIQSTLTVINEFVLLRFYSVHFHHNWTYF